MILVIILIIAPVALALYFSFSSYFKDGDLKSEKLIHKHNNLLFLAQSPLILIKQPQIHNFLNKEFPYYQKLSIDEKRKFALRVGGFMVNTKFSGKEGFVVTEEVKIYISAAAVQLTFGLDGYLLENIDYIQVFPEKYYSRMSEAYFKGEYRKDRLIRYSWVDFKKGYDMATSGVNLGLHEMAHALELGMLESNSTDGFFENYYIRWRSVMKKTFLEMAKENKKTILRSYAKSNEHEFFAVSVEHFFERPQEFKENLPDVYETLAILLNQDPLQIGKSPRIHEIPEIENLDFPEHTEKMCTNFSIGRFIRLIVRIELVVPVGFVLYLFHNSISSLSFILTVSLTLLSLSAQKFLQSAIIHVYDKGMTFTNPFSLRKTHRFGFDNIVSATVNISLTGKKTLEVYYTNKGQFGKKTFYLPSAYDNIKQVLGVLKEKNIHIYDKGLR